LNNNAAEKVLPFLMAGMKVENFEQIAKKREE